MALSITAINTTAVSIAVRGAFFVRLTVAFFICMLNVEESSKIMQIFMLSAELFIVMLKGVMPMGVMLMGVMLKGIMLMVAFFIYRLSVVILSVVVPVRKKTFIVEFFLQIHSNYTKSERSFKCMKSFSLSFSLSLYLSLSLSLFHSLSISLYHTHTLTECGIHMRTFIF
jgi:hypothetical protein